MFTALFQNKKKMFFCFIFFLFYCNSIARGETYTPPPSSAVSFLRMIISLIIVFIIFYLVIILLKFFLGKKILGGTKKRLYLLDAHHIGPNLSLYLIQSGGKALLIAANANHITLLQETEEPEISQNNLPDNEVTNLGENFKSAILGLLKKEGGKNEKS